MEMTMDHGCVINKTGVFLNNRLLVSRDPQLDFHAFLKSVYRDLGIDYPRFFKMDRMCKLGFLASEILIMNTPAFKEFKNEEVGMVFMNRSSCLDTDLKYYETIKDSSQYFPSPSLFVYTLPNILMGEIAIRHRIKGEGIFFIVEHKDPELLVGHINRLIQQQAIHAVLCGWVDVFEDDFEANVFLMQAGEGQNESTNFGGQNVAIVFQT